MALIRRTFARHQSELTPCEHCPKRRVPGTRRLASTGFTGFVRHHPFKPDWEVRRCFTCGRLTAQSARS